MGVRPVAGWVGVVLCAAHRVPALGAPPQGGSRASLPACPHPSPPGAPRTTCWWPPSTCSNWVGPHVPLGTGLGEAASATGAGPEKDQQGCHLPKGCLRPRGGGAVSVLHRAAGEAGAVASAPPNSTCKSAYPSQAGGGVAGSPVEGGSSAACTRAEDALLPAGPGGPLLRLPRALQAQVLLRVPQVPGGARAPL